jgi:hypothetical protein
MKEDDQIEQEVKATLLNLMYILYQSGIDRIHLGGLMRIMGIENEQAAEHDDEIIEMNPKFVKYIESINEPAPPGSTLH